MKPFDFLTHEFSMLDVVYNEEKQNVQIVLAKIPFAMRGMFGVPRMKKCYICSDTEKRNWSVELGENLRLATIFDRKL